KFFIIKDDLISDERQDVQKKTFTKWINSQLSKTTCPLVIDLFEDLRDGHRLLSLLEVLTNQQYKREKGRMRVHHINNVNKVLQVLSENGVKLLNISSEDIVGGNPKLTLGLISIIALCFDGKKLVNSETVSGLEKNLLRWVEKFTEKYQLMINDFTTSWSSGLAFLYILHEFGIDFDLEWAKKQHPIARLRLAFDLATRYLRIDALLDPEDVNTNKPDKKSVLMYVMCLYQAIESLQSSQLSNAPSIHMLDQHFEGSSEEINPTSSDDTPQPSTSKYLPAETESKTPTGPLNIVNSTDLDEVSLAKSIEDLSSNFPVQRSRTFTITKNESINLTVADTETPDVDDENNKTNDFQTFLEAHSRPVSTATNSLICSPTEIVGYQNAIEIVLTLLLEAEEMLSKPPLPDIKELSDAKARFQAHEEFMIKLSEYQEYVGGALEEGARLLSEPINSTGLTVEDKSEIKQQMLLLNERWELLRISALDVQSCVHSKLAEVQTQKIEDLRGLLTNTEDRISRMLDIDPSPDAMSQQIREHKELEASLNEQKGLVDELSNLVVIVNDDSFIDLEDRLLALGERWTHVVQWTKNRFQKLQEVHWNWKILNRQFEITNEWINVRENDLKQMESHDVSAIGSVMERIKNLRFCAMDLNVLYDSLVRLEEIAQVLKPASIKLLEQLENKQDRCEALKEIVDVQQQRIEGMGFDFNIDISDNEKLPNNWTDFQSKFNSQSLMEFGEPDGSIQREKEQDDPPQSKKKQKFQPSEKYQQLNKCLKDMNNFVALGEKILSEFKKNPTLREETSALENLQIQLKMSINEYPKIKILLNDCIEEDGHDLPGETTEISNIGTKYDELNFRIEHMLELNAKATMKETFSRNLTGLKLVLADCQDWFKQYANLNSSTQEELENRLSYMESLSSEIDDAQDFYRNSEDKNDLSEWKQNFDQFYQSWKDVKRAIKRLLCDKFETVQIDDDSELLETLQNPEMEKFDAVHAEAVKASVIVSSLEKMRANLHRLNELKPIIIEIGTNKAVKKNPIEFDKWKKLATAIEELIMKQTTSIENVIHFMTEFEEVVKFLSNLEKTLTNDLFVLGEEDELKHQEQQYESNGMEIKKIEIDIISVKNFSEIIVRESTDNEQNFFLLNQIKSLNNLYTSVKKTFQTNKKALQQALEQTSNIYQRINDVELWLNELELSTPTIYNADIKSSNQLFQIRNKFQSLKETCEQKTVEFRELNDVGNEMLLRIDEQLTNHPIYRCKNGTKSTLAKQFTKLNAKWNEVTTLVYNRTALLEHISSQLGELKTLIVCETGYLDKLEKCLRKSPGNAADAEEIYEELDDLENSIRNHSEKRLNKIKELGNELIGHNCMAESIKVDVKSVIDRWDILQHKGKQRQMMLEGLITEAQTSERRIQNFQHWIKNVAELLNEHLDNDTTANDLPHDFQRLVEEFGANEKNLNEMKKEVELYRVKGKAEAAFRLCEQVQLLEECFLSNQAKLKTFTSPQANFESRLNRAMGELRTVERSSCILDVASAGLNNIQDQYKHCLKMYRSLSEVKNEIENVIKTGRKICEDKSTKYAKKLTLSIDALKHLYNNLGEHVTQSKIHLEKLLRLATAIQTNIAKIERWLNFTELAPVQRNEILDKDHDPVLKLSNEQVGAMIEKCNNIYEEYIRECDPAYMEDLQSKIDNLSQRFIKITVNDFGKDLLEIKTNLQNLDNISIDTLRSIERDLQNMDVTSSDIQKLHQQVAAIVQETISSHPKNKEDDDMEIVVVSDTVRQRRSRTPSSSASTSNDNEIMIVKTQSDVLPDLLPKTFHLAESSTLFFQADNSKNLLVQKEKNRSSESKFSIVEIRETNILSPKRATFKTHESFQNQNVSHVLNTCSILESVNYLEPSCVETVHIIDASSEASDNETPCSTPNLDERSDSRISSDEEESDEFDYKTNTKKIVNKRLSLQIRDVLEINRLNLPKNTKEFDSSCKIPPEPQRKKITPTLEEILSATSDSGSLNSPDKEVFGRSMTFSVDDYNNHLNGQSTEKFNRDTDRMAKPNAGKPTVMHERKLEPVETENATENQSEAHKSITTKAKTFSMKKTSNSRSLSQRVYEFERTARYMIKKLQDTKEKIDASIIVAVDSETIEHLQMLVAPDAATLISQGDSLVLETHGNASSELANTVIEMQSILREKFREVQHAKLSIECQQNSSLEVGQKLLKYESLDKEIKLNEVSKVPANNIDEDAWYVCNKVWKLLQSSVNGSNEIHLKQRLADIKSLQTEIKVQWKFASQATPSPRAKATMETLDQTRNDLSYHYDYVVQSLKELNARAGSGDSEKHNNDERKHPDGKPVDNKVQDVANSEKKARRTRLTNRDGVKILFIDWNLAQGA
ncbi:dystrophin, isoforms A/C/F/G/H-like, partial [Sitodiplosis mosellana]|uniref:dystrophin, isoforms A/C/F/G/H-like n=1 Tax=Sitodiplosis mosellana TaxID=263140 RepID=UPI002443D1C5